jgi:hypothetical protein
MPDSTPRQPHVNAKALEDIARLAATLLTLLS